MRFTKTEVSLNPLAVSDADHIVPAYVSLV